MDYLWTFLTLKLVTSKGMRNLNYLYIYVNIWLFDLDLTLLGEWCIHLRYFEFYGPLNNIHLFWLNICQYISIFVRFNQIFDPLNGNKNIFVENQTKLWCCHPYTMYTSIFIPSLLWFIHFFVICTKNKWTS